MIKRTQECFVIPKESMTSEIVNCFSFIVPPPPLKNIKVKSYVGEKDCKCFVRRGATSFPLLPFARRLMEASLFR